MLNSEKWATCSELRERVSCRLNIVICKSITISRLYMIYIFYPTRSRQGCPGSQNLQNAQIPKQKSPFPNLRNEQKNIKPPNCHREAVKAFARLLKELGPSSISSIKRFGAIHRVRVMNLILQERLSSLCDEDLVGLQEPLKGCPRYEPGERAPAEGILKTN